MYTTTTLALALTQLVFLEKPDKTIKPFLTLDTTDLQHHSGVALMDLMFTTQTRFTMKA